MPIIALLDGELTRHLLFSAESSKLVYKQTKKFHEISRSCFLLTVERLFLTDTTEKEYNRLRWLPLKDAAVRSDVGDLERSFRWRWAVDDLESNDRRIRPEVVFQLRIRQDG